MNGLPVDFAPLSIFPEETAGVTLADIRAGGPQPPPSDDPAVGVIEQPLVQGRSTGKRFGRTVAKECRPLDYLADPDTQNRWHVWQRHSGGGLLLKRHVRRRGQRITYPKQTDHQAQPTCPDCTASHEPPSG